MNQRLCATWAAALGLAVGSTFSHAQSSPQVSAKIDFATEIQPIFRQHCISCHGPKEQKNGLRLDRRRDAMRGGTIAVIGPGNADGSRLYHRLIGDKFGIQMPPTGALSPEKIARIKLWIDQGAEWPDALAGDRPPTVPDPAAVRVSEFLRAGDRTGFVAALGADPAVVNKPGPGGATPLMFAALYGDAASVRVLIDRGADVNAVNDEGATALMWAVPDLEKTTLLLAAGASVNAQSADSRTPLLIAAGIRHSAPVVRLLLDKGANIKVRAPGLFGETTPLLQAAFIGDAETFKLLAGRGADVESVAPFVLALGSRADCRDCADAALKYVGPPGFTGLLQAVLPPGSTAESVPRLLAAGADPKVPGPDGRTSLMLAAASETAPVESVKALIAAGLAIDARDPLGRTALTYARMHGRTPVVELLEKAGAVDGAPAPPAPRNFRPATSVRAAITRSLPLIQAADDQFLKKAACVSCHNNSVAAMTVSLARARKIPVNEHTAKHQTKAIGDYLHNWRERALQGIGIPGDTTTIGYILVGLAAENHPADIATDAMAKFLLEQQMQSGAWLPLASRPPIEGNTIQSTAITMMALKAYAPAAQRDVYDAAIRRGAEWLRTQTPATNEGRAFQLLGFDCGEVDDATRRTSAKALIAQQRADGGWAQLSTLPSDAYATGQALVALAKTGLLPVKDPVYRKGVQYLMKTQFADGSWYVRTRAIPIQPHFESGFPYGKDQFISAAATNWSTMALLFAETISEGLAGSRPAMR
jgi:ankyrin repeat protein